jgi:hypothetical protein
MGAGTFLAPARMIISMIISISGFARLMPSSDAVDSEWNTAELTVDLDFQVSTHVYQRYSKGASGSD